VVPTLTFHLLFVFVVLRHHRRELLHVNVTDHPSAVWTARQLIEAFPEETGSKCLLRDRNSIYGEAFTRCLNTWESGRCRHFRLEDLHRGEALRDGLGRPLAGRE
jgi:hypothetical protein